MKRRNFFGLLAVLAVGPTLAQAPSVAPAPQVAQVSQQAMLEMQVKKDASLLLLDVRTPEEFAAGHIPGAVNIPFNEVAGHLSEIPKDDEVVLYCHSGRRAGLAAEALAANGYTKLAHLEGDMQGWQRSNRPVEASAGPAPAK